MKAYYLAMDITPIRRSDDIAKHICHHPLQSSTRLNSSGPSSRAKLSVTVSYKRRHWWSGSVKQLTDRGTIKKLVFAFCRCLGKCCNREQPWCAFSRWIGRDKTSWICNVDFWAHEIRFPIAGVHKSELIYYIARLKWDNNTNYRNRHILLRNL